MSTNNTATKAAPVSPLFSACSTTEFVQNIIHNVLTSDEWEAFVMSAPQIRKAEKELYTELFKLPTQTRLDIEFAHAGVVDAYMDAAALFGMHFMESIKATAATPFVLFQGVTDSKEA